MFILAPQVSSICWIIAATSTVFANCTVVSCICHEDIHFLIKLSRFQIASSVMDRITYVIIYRNKDGAAVVLGIVLFYSFGGY